MSSDDQLLIGQMYRDQFLENEYLCAELTRRIRENAQLAVLRDKYRRRVKELEQRLRAVGVNPDAATLTEGVE